MVFLIFSFLALYTEFVDNLGSMLPSLYSLNPNRLSALCQSLQVPNGNVTPMLRSIYQASESNGHQVSKKLSTYIHQYFDDTLPMIDRYYDSKEDGSRKLILNLHDNEQIETVIIPEKSRVTLCVSSQVGCAQGCRFCHTGRMGLKRHLSAAEILSQILIAKKMSDRAIQNIVFMGMGEPLDNVDNVVEAIHMLTDPHILNFAKRKISVSTVGHIDGLNRLMQLDADVRLAVSIHAPNDELRSRIMPIAKKWPLADLIETLRLIQVKNPTRTFLIQYTLMAGINDSTQHAHELSALLRPLRVKINLIPYNEIEVTRFKRPSQEAVQVFRDVLHADGYRTLVRYSKGQDIAAACGQLITTPKESSAPC
jgi:23S rRNA (adenine2503-C2)-methyltransferase